MLCGVLRSSFQIFHGTLIHILTNSCDVAVCHCTLHNVACPTKETLQCCSTHISESPFFSVGLVLGAGIATLIVSMLSSVLLRKNNLFASPLKKLSINIHMDLCIQIQLKMVLAGVVYVWKFAYQLQVYFKLFSGKEKLKMPPSSNNSVVLFWKYTAL